MILTILGPALIGIAGIQGAHMDRGDAIYQAGLEGLVAQSKVIVTGPVSDYAKHVLRSDPGSETPLLWEIQGEVRHPQALKGSAPTSPIHFTRPEQAVFMSQPEKSPWEIDYLQWQTGDKALLFFTSADTSAGMRVYPSGQNERDLAGQVGRIAAIQSIDDPEKRFQAWQKDLQTAVAPEEKRAALRSLLAFHKSWNEMLPILREAIQAPDIAMQSFIFNLVSFGIRRGTWPQPLEPASFLCEQLVAATNTNLALRNVGAVGSLMLYANEEQHRAERRELREQLNRCLEQRCLSGGREIIQACEDLRSRFAH